MTDAEPKAATAELTPQEIEAADQAALAALDQAISEHDPEFKNALSGIGPDLQPENLHLFDLNADMEQLNDKKVTKFFGRLKLTIKRSFKIFLTRLILFFKQTIPELLKTTFELLKSGFSSFKNLLKAFGKLKSKQKLATIICTVLILTTGFLIHRFSTRGLLEPRVQLFTPSLEEFAEQSTFLAPDEPYESFYDSSRVSQNVMNLKKMIVNLRASETSGQHPMAAIEFFVEGYAPEVVIEVKDREAEIQDLFQRIIEGMTYDELDQTAGKKVLQERLRDRVNQILTQGNVKRVFFKNLILKP